MTTDAMKQISKITSNIEKKTKKKFHAKHLQRVSERERKNGLSLKLQNK